ncbi:MAG: methyltransferase family protein [Bacilli bacterium]
MNNNKNHDRPGVIAPPPLIYLGGIAIGWVIQLLYPIHFFSKGYIALFGILLILVGCIVIYFGMRTMRLAGTNVNPERPATTIVQSGPFRFSRNPLYLSLSIIQLGMAIAVNSIWILLTLFVCVVVVTMGVIRREELYLERKFAEEYLLYKRKVRRWL